MDIAIHINIKQPHQREHAQWLKQGLKKHGLDLIVTDSIATPADVHIVSGPHYAKQRWLHHPNVIFLDRAKYHEERAGHWHSMDWVSLGWMNSRGGCDYELGEGREPPQVKQTTGTKTIFLADYNGQIEQADIIRRHPDNEAHTTTLEYDLSQCNKAIGYQTSALVTAGLMGLEIECKDSTNIMYQDNWLELLPYADWHYSEIQSGEAWEHLCR